MKTFCVTSTQSVPLRVGVKLEEFDEDERVENWSFRELDGSLMRLSIMSYFRRDDEALLAAALTGFT